MDDAELKAAFEAELGALEQSGALMPILFTPRQAWRLLGILQTCVLLRLADSPEDDRYARELAANIEGWLCKMPAMKEMAERGKASHPPVDPPSSLDEILRESPPETKTKRKRP